MSTEEDTELRDLVAQTLEINGCLPKIRAELRASIFLALDEDDELQKQEPLSNKKVKTHLESEEGRIMFCLVREFLEYFNLDFTISVYEPESYLGAGYQYEGRTKLIDDLGMLQLDSTRPLLLQIVQMARVNSRQNIDINLSKLQNKDCSFEDESSSSSTSDKVFTKSKTEVSEHSNVVLKPITEMHAGNLNATFCVKHDEEVSAKVEDVIVSEDKDDTYDGTSSITEDSVKDSPSPLDLDKSMPNSDKSQSLSETEFSPPILKDSKSHSKFDVSFDKLKLSPQKTEKFKAKTSLSSLADLPPLQLNKSRNDTVLLPSLYSKEFKEKTNPNLRDLDRFFDVDADYEEDFMSESEINLNKSSRSNLLDELQDSNKNVRMQETMDANQNLETGKTELNLKSTNGVDNSGASSVISDDLNINDILYSPTSN